MSAAALTQAHERAVAATALLEAPGPGAGPRRPGLAIHRAQDSGNVWLQRLPFAPHAAATVEPALLGGVRPPELTYVPAIPRSLARSGVLSELQLEALLAIGRCHARRLQTGEAAASAPASSCGAAAAPGAIGGAVCEAAVSGASDSIGGVRAGFLLADGPGVGKGRTQVTYKNGS